jgi:hypothetical protein
LFKVNAKNYYLHFVLSRPGHPLKSSVIVKYKDFFLHILNSVIALGVCRGCLFFTVQQRLTEHEKKLLAHRAWSALPIGGGGHRSATTIGAPIHPEPIVLAHQKINALQVHRVNRVLGFLSSRPNWDSPTP